MADHKPYSTSLTRIHNVPIGKLPAIVTATTPATVQAATAATPAAPTASREEIAALELMLSEPATQDMIRHFGGPMPSLGGNPVADSIVQRYGADLANRLQQLHNAQHAVRQEYLRALDRAQQQQPGTGGAAGAPARGPAQTPGWHFVPGQSIDDDGRWAFDPVAFTRHWSAGDSPAQRAFAHLYGPSPLTQAHRQAGDSEETYLSLAGQELRLGRQGTEPADPWENSGLNWFSGSINPANPDKLHNPAATWFDPVHGWMTPPNNIKGDWFERLVGVGAAAFATVVSGGVAAGLMPGMIAGQAAFTAGVSSIMQQGISGSGFSFRDVLRSALGGALNARLMPALRQTGIADQGAGILDRLLQASGPTGIQNVLRDIVGVSTGFRSDATPALLHQVAREMHTRIDAFLSQNPFLNASEHSALRILSRATENALRALGNPGDPAAGFARDFLNSLSAKE